MKRPKAKIIFIIAISFLFGFKIIASESNIIFSEIAWMGTENSSNDEWIELKNNTGSNIDLAGWTLIAQDGSPTINLSGTIPANGYFLLERTDDESAPGITADQIYTGAIGNNGEILEMRDSENNLVDIIDASSGWQAGDNSSKLTMAKVDGQWQNSQNAGGTPKETNSIGLGNDTEVEEEQAQEQQEDGEQENQSQDESEISYKLGNIVINEFVSDPADAKQEFIELYNATNQEIDLSSWIIEDGSGAKTSLDGVIRSNKFFIIEKPKGNLNNKGDIIILHDATNNLIDKVAYGNWDDGSLENNAPIATDPYSVARKFDGQNSYNNANDFAITTTITKNSSNIITAIKDGESEEENIKNKNYNYSNDIIVSEIFPNPEGVDNEDEFVELYNKGEQDVNLIGWKVGDNSKRKYKIIEDKIIKAQQYLIIYRSESKIALNNGGDSIKIYQPVKDEAYLKIEYDKAIEGWSFNNQLNHENDYVWSEVVTPGYENIIKTINHPPVIDFDFPDIIIIATPTIFNSSDTEDIDGDELKYFWSFGDGFTNILPNPEHTFFAAGNYTIKLIVSDGENEEFREKIVKVIDKNINLDIDNTLKATSTKNIIITEILPNPYGSDGDEEWIEIYNNGLGEVSLDGWTIDDGEGGSKPYAFQENILVGSNQYYLINREDSKIGLNNNGDSARLFDSLDELVAEVQYERSFEGESYSRGENGEWFWTEVLTPGFDNEESRIKTEEFYNQNQIWVDPIAELDIQKNSKEFIQTDLEKIKESIAGDLVIVNGVVAVKPGILGSQYFYIVGSPGVQIYNYKKDFPNLRIGDYIEVSGEVAISGEEMRIKTKLQEDIKIIEHREEPEAKIITSEAVNENAVGQLIKITGEVVERKGSSIYFDDGVGEVLVYIKSGIGVSAKSIEEGGNYVITGIVSHAKSGVRIMPRAKDDIIKKDAESGKEKQKMPGQISDSDNLIIAQRDKKLKLFQYLLTISGGTIAVLGGLLVKMK